MAMSQSERKKIYEWFASRGVGPGCNCELCNGKLALVLDYVAMPYRGSDNFEQYVAVTCLKCGHALFFNADIMGI